MIFHQPHNSLNNSFNAVFYTDDIWKPHFHKGLEFISVIKGCLHCNVNGTKYLLKPNEFGLCLPYDIHDCKPENDTVYWICVFAEDYVHDFAKTVRNKTGDFKFHCKESVARFINESLIYNPSPSRFIIKSALYAVCDEYTKFAKITDKSERLSENIAKITEYVEKNYSKDIKLSDIGRLLGYDYHYVSRYFHAVFKMSFKEFLALYRLEAAAGLIERGDKKMLDIALESGFQSVRNFNESFKSHFKMTPTEYKKSLHPIIY